MVIITGSGQSLIIDTINGVDFITKGDEVGVILSKNFSKDLLKKGKGYFLTYCPIERAIEGKLYDFRSRRIEFFCVRKIME